MNDEIRYLVFQGAFSLYERDLLAYKGVIFMAIEPNGTRDPSANLLRRFAKYPFKVLPISQAVITKEGIFTRSTQQKSSMVYPIYIKFIRKDLVEARGSLHNGGRSGSGWMVRISKIKGKWQVVKANKTGMA